MKKNKFISVVAILIFVLSLTIAGLWGFLLFKKKMRRMNIDKDGCEICLLYQGRVSELLSDDFLN